MNSVMEMEMEIENIYKHANDVNKLLNTLDKCIILSDKEEAFYCINLFYSSYHKIFGIFKLIDKFINFYIKYIKNCNIFIYFNTLIVKLFNIHENNELSKESKESKERQNVYKIINLLCDSKKCFDNLYYKFCLYSFHYLEEKEKIKLKENFIFFEDIYYTEYISYTPTKMPGYIINLNKDLIILSKNFVGSLEQKNDMCIYYAHCLYNYNKKIPKYFEGFSKPVDLLFDLIKFVFVNNNSKYLHLFDILLTCYNMINLDLCWQTLLLYEINSNLNIIKSNNYKNAYISYYNFYNSTTSN